MWWIRAEITSLQIKRIFPIKIFNRSELDIRTLRSSVADGDVAYQARIGAFMIVAQRYTVQAQDRRVADARTTVLERHIK